MRLVIVSHTPHYRRGELTVGWGPTVREIDYLASLFEEVVHVAPLHAGSAPESATGYRAPNVTVSPVGESGSEVWWRKLKILALWPAYFFTLAREFRRADVVHVRCPANIAMLAVVMLPLFRRRHARWIKYGGNWNPGHDDPPAYRFQRWWLRHGPLSARVTVNGPLPGDPSHVHHFLNPCLTEQELAEGRQAAREKRMDSPLRLLYVGGIEPAKGSIRTIRILAAVVERGIDAALDVVGDGPGRADAEKLAAELGVADRARFHGWAPRSEIPGFLRGGHILLLPSDSEGWPKVLSEAMAYGVIPIASDVSSIKQVLAECGAGVAVALNDISGYADAVRAYALDSERWRREVRDGALAAERFGYTEYLSRVRRLLDLPEPERDPTHSIAAAEPAPTR